MEFSGQVVNALADADRMPVGLIIKTLHSATALDFRERSEDDEELRNVLRYCVLEGIPSTEFAKISLSGTFKPERFIHIFERYYSSPGYMDKIALKSFFNAVDILYFGSKNPNKEWIRNYLAFIYIGFLVIHPFVDRNGRTVRALLNYYNVRLGSKFSGTWNKGFKNRPEHGKAFRYFFKWEVKVPTIESLNLEHPFPIEPRLEPHLLKLTAHIVNWFDSVAKGEEPAKKNSIRLISSLIK